KFRFELLHNFALKDIQIHVRNLHVVNPVSLLCSVAHGLAQKTITRHRDIQRQPVIREMINQQAKRYQLAVNQNAVAIKNQKSAGQFSFLSKGGPQIATL
ncbi:MAG: hypothetical protein ABJC34_07060, partial [Marinomonas sp.]